MKETTLVAHLPGVGAREKIRWLHCSALGGLTSPATNPPGGIYPLLKIKQDF